MKKVLLIVNPVAGKLRLHSELFDIVEVFCNNGYIVTTAITQYRNHGKELAASARENGYDLVVCCGGDGTLNEAISGLLETTDRANIPLGYIPAGSTNDFAKTLYRRDHVSVRDVCRHVLAGRTKKYDIGAFNDRYFNDVACFGAFTKVSYTTPRDMKNALGYGAYVLNLIGMIPEDINYVRHVRFIHDGIKEEGDFLAGFVSNSISVAGIRNPLIGDSEIDDGYFELTMIQHPENPLDAAGLGGELLAGTGEDRFVRQWRVKSLQMEFDEDTPWTMDGETGRNYRRVNIEVVTKKISIYTDR